MLHDPDPFSAALFYKIFRDKTVERTQIEVSQPWAGIVADCKALQATAVRVWCGRGVNDLIQDGQETLVLYNTVNHASEPV